MSPVLIFLIIIAIVVVLIVIAGLIFGLPWLRRRRPRRRFGPLNRVGLAELMRIAHP